MNNTLKLMRTSELRARFLDYFQEHQHQTVESSSLVPHNDQSLLFTNAGMVQFKDTFLGNEERSYSRATTAQKCLRAGGKHNDLENVGYTARHHTFFEMMGNFSFGDYFKRQGIELAWQFLVDVLKIPKERLWITVFDKDPEAEAIWLNEIGVDPTRFSRIGEKDNFWSMGEVGPCGPCSEIFYDHGPEYWGGPPGTKDEDGDRYIEIWNLVFMQYDRTEDGSLTPLPKPSVDTGMGLERMAAVLQGVNNNYQIDLFDNLISKICSVTGTSDKSHHSVRVIADHIRACAFLIADGVEPANEGRGYVLRRIIRRAVRHGNQIGAVSPFFYQIAEALEDEMGEAYPQLKEQSKRIQSLLKREEVRFAETLEQGLKILNSKLEDNLNGLLPGEVVFQLYDTYGFPVDLTADVAREHELEIDYNGFEELMNEQRIRARSKNQFAQADTKQVEFDGSSEFVGYESLTSNAKVIGLIHETRELDEVSGPTQLSVIVDRSPFYPEGGGQVGDKGRIYSNGIDGDTEVIGKIDDCRRLAKGALLHLCHLDKGKLTVGQEVSMVVDAGLRKATAANHSATHLLHAALKKVLGNHVVQKGSLVQDDKLRFDFSHSAPVSKAEISQIERLVNQQIFEGSLVTSQLMPIDQAKEAGAEALFGEKYGDEVRVISMSDFSLELCGGTHVSQLSEIGIVKITAESGVAAGVRRIEAVSGVVALEYLSLQQDVLNQLSDSLKTRATSLVDRVHHLQANSKKLESEKRKLQKTLAEGGGDSDVFAEIMNIGDIKLLTKRVEVDDKAVLRSLIDKFRSQNDDGVIVLGAEIEGKAILIAGASKSLHGRVQAGKLIAYLTGMVGGRGGGRPDLAEGGVPNVVDIDTCLASVKEWLEEQVDSQ